MGKGVRNWLAAGAKRILPAPVVDALRRARKALRRAAFWKTKLTAGEEARVTRQDIYESLRELGIRSGDDVLVHSSLRGLGVVEGGAETVIRALQETIGREGTLLAPAYPMKGTMLEHLRAGGMALDARNSPSQMGKISELIRTLPGAHRSLHPTHSVAAAGPRAAYYTEGHERSSTPCGSTSPMFRLMERKGWILAVGSPIGKITSYHVLEDLVSDFPYRVYLDEDFEVQVTDADGNVRHVRAKCHDPELARTRIDNNREKEQQFERLLSQRGVLRQRRVGRGVISAMRADELEAVLEALLRDGITIYGRDTERR